MQLSHSVLLVDHSSDLSLHARSHSTLLTEEMTSAETLMLKQPPINAPSAQYILQDHLHELPFRKYNGLLPTFWL
jgi:hypothetical protein